MRILTFLFIFFFFCLSASNAQKKATELTGDKRIEKIINSGWTFNYFPNESADKGYEPLKFDDSKWTAISIPHTWSTYETTGELHPFIRNASEEDNYYWWYGWGWYRKHFTVNPAYSGKKIFIEFEGVQKYSKVWINGKYLGDHKGGYGSFDFDITQYLNKGGDNVIAVAVNNKRDDEFRIPPMSAGNFNVYGGIYRNVSIVLKNNLYIPMQGSATHEGGTYITTPDLNEKSGIVRIQTWVKNDNSQNKSCILQTTVLDAAGKTVQIIKTPAEIKPGEIYRFDQSTKPVKNPRLWSPEDPYLYEVLSEVIDGKVIVDNYTSSFGFRWFRWDDTDNFLYVNGRKTGLHGGNRHQEYPWLGDAIPQWITVMDMADISENLKYNFMRTAHYPNDKLVYDLADKTGIIIDEETPSIKNKDFSPDVQEQQMKEMIRRDRNHPSIMFWSMGNETDHATDSRFAFAEDTTRIITARHVSNTSAGRYVRHGEDNLAIENLLRCTVRGWYNSDVKNLEPSDCQQSGTEEHHVEMLKESNLVGRGNLITWLYADHGADREYLNSPLMHVNPKGYVDAYRIPKYAYYFWQANYSDKPLVFIVPHYWRSAYLGQTKDIEVYSNCEKVEMKVNGKSLGVQIPDEKNFHTVLFKGITITNGELVATGTKNGSTVTAKVAMAGDPVRVALKSSALKMTADRGSVAIITADIRDKDGNHIYGANNTLKWAISGPATLVGPSEWESDINKHEEMEGEWYIDTPVSNVIRSNGEPGLVSIRVFSAGLVSGSIDILFEKPKTDNTIIVENELKDAGRVRVTRPVLDAERMDDIPSEIQYITNEVKLVATDKSGYKKAVCEYLRMNNQGTDTATTEFRSFATLLSSHLLNNNGIISAEDYNFNALHYNNCRQIATYITATKLPPVFKEGLRNYYSSLIIVKGNERNAGDEMNWLNWIPSGGTVVYSEINPKPAVKGVLVTGKDELADLISLVHPGFPKFGEEARQRALEFIDKMNPYVTAVVTSEAGSDGKEILKTVLKAERGKPVLIPLIKFISE